MPKIAKIPLPQQAPRLFLLTMFRRQKGFTLLELMIAVAIFGVLAAIALPNYWHYLETTRYAVVITEMRQIDRQAKMFFIANNNYPDTLAQIGYGNLKDPWGNSYQYLNIQTAAGKDQAKIRKDHSLHPVNSDFDLYSMGPDGKSAPPFTVKVSLDDIVRTQDGAFIGRVSDY